MHDFGSILNFIQYVFKNQGMVQGDISTTQPQWQYDDAWAPDYWGSPKPLCTQQQCPFPLFDFFGNPTIGYFTNKRKFTAIQPQTYQPSSFVGLGAWGGNNEADDLETP